MVKSSVHIDPKIINLNIEKPDIKQFKKNVKNQMM